MSQATILIKHTDVMPDPYEGEYGLDISELFYHTIQGEGKYSGHPAVFLRLQRCLQNCIFCDTRDIWKQGNRFSHSYLIHLIKEECFKWIAETDAHLVVTGGAPLLQQKELAVFLAELRSCYYNEMNKSLFIEIENEASVVPNTSILSVIDCWNNSPKLANSLVPREQRFNIKSLKLLAGLHNSWFKFVVSKPRDWDEIKKVYLPIIGEEKLMLMPMGTTIEQLDANLELIKGIQKDHPFVTICDREHIRLNKK